MSDDYFDEELAVAELLIEGVAFLNCRSYKHDARRWAGGPDGRTVVVYINCNDIFAWASADGEDIEFSELRSLYEAWKADKRWGAAKWVAKRRNEQPQGPVIEAMKNDGSWDDEMEALSANRTDAVVQQRFAELRAKLQQEREE